MVEIVIEVHGEQPSKHSLKGKLDAICYLIRKHLVGKTGAIHLWWQRIELLCKWRKLWSRGSKTMAHYVCTPNFVAVSLHHSPSLSLVIPSLAFSVSTGTFYGSSRHE